MWRRRERWYDECSRYLFVVRPGDTAWPAIATDLERLLRTVANDPAPPLWTPLAGVVPDHGRPRFFLSLTYPDLEAAVPDLATVAEGVDALELRVDLLAQYDHGYVADQVRARSHLARTEPDPVVV